MPKFRKCLLGPVLLLAVHPLAAQVRFEPVQRDLFAAPGAQPNAWADFDNDGDLDLFVGFRGGTNRLYRNDGGTFTDVAAAVGVADTLETRAAAWGDFDGDGHLDLFVGFTPASPLPSRLYRNLGDGARFEDVAARVGVAVSGATTRQPAFVDFDNDGDVDLFVAFRDRPNALFRNDGGRFTDVAPTLGIADPRRTVGTVWFDFDQDGDLDLFVANQNGDANGFFRNDGGRFTDVAAQVGVDEAGRSEELGGVGPAVTDFDNDGDLDLFVANYGPDALYRNDGGRFTDMGPALGLGEDYHSTTAAWGDFDNDGRPDLYVASFMGDDRDARDHLFHNRGDRFVDVLPDAVRRDDASHGVQWADFDADGDLDLALANNHRSGVHFLFRNQLPADAARRALQVLVLDGAGRHSRAGSEVRVFRAGTRELLGTRLVDAGGGYDSQNAAPVHFGLPRMERVDVEVTWFSPAGRRTTRVADVDPAALSGRALVVRAGDGAPASAAPVPAPRQTQADDYTRYELLEPGSGKFRILYEVSATTPGAPFFFNIIRRGSVATDEAVYDRATGQPLRWEVVDGAMARAGGVAGAEAQDHYIRVHLPRPVPEGGEVRLLIDKTYEDAKSYFLEDGLLVFDRSLGIKRNSVVLPAGWELVGVNYPSQVIPLAEGRLMASFLNVGPAAVPYRIRARRLP